MYVFHPVKSKVILTRRFVKVIVSLLVMSSILFEVPRYFEREVTTFSMSNKLFNIHLTYSRYTELWKNTTYQIIFRAIAMPVVRLFLPLVITSVLTTNLVLLLMKQRTKKATLIGARNPQSNKDTRNERITFVLVFIAGFFIFTSIATCIYPILEIILDDTESCYSFYSYFATIANTLKVLNSAVNIFIFYATVPAFRRLFWDSLGCCFCRQREKLTPSATQRRTTPCFIIFRFEVSAGMVDPQN